MGFRGLVVLTGRRLRKMVLSQSSPVMAIEALRTPDSRFDGLPEYDFEPNYVEYIDVGPRDADPVLLMHGEPSWCFLYRKVIHRLVELGHRCIAPDLIGFGRSDKPVRQGDYSYAAHVRWATKFFTALGLDRVTLVCQDWGGLVGLRLVAAMPDRFARVVAANTGLPTGDMPMPKAFKEWQAYSRRANPFNVGPIISRAVAKPMSPAVLAAYDAPFPDESFKAGAKIFPSLVPSTPDDPEAPAQRAAWEVLQRYSRPFLTAFSDKDPVTRGGDLLFQGMVPGAEGQAHKTLKGGGHFLQEDVGVELADVVHAFIVDTADAHTRPALKSSL